MWVVKLDGRSSLIHLSFDQSLFFFREREREIICGMVVYIE